MVVLPIEGDTSAIGVEKFGDGIEENEGVDDDALEAAVDGDIAVEGYFVDAIDLLDDGRAGICDNADSGSNRGVDEATECVGCDSISAATYCCDG